MACATPCLALFLLMSMACDGVSCSRLLLLPSPYPSHIQELVHIGEELSDRGHDIHLLLPSHHPGLENFRKSNIKLMTYDSIYPDYLMTPPEFKHEIFEQVLHSVPVDTFRLLKGMVEVCYNLLESKELEDLILSFKFDMFIVDGFPVVRCFLILPYRLGIPYISVTTTYEPWLYRNPALPSFVPFPMHDPPLTPEMSFWERLSNAASLFDWTYRTTEMAFLDDKLVERFAPNRPAVSINELAGRSLLWLFDTDHAIDYPRPMMPNEINIGGLSVKPSNPLPAELERFVVSAPKGTLLAAFGSHSVIPEKYLHKMIEACKMLPSDYHIVFRWNGDFLNPEVPENILLLDWVPQNDILGHNNTRLFLTHAGANGQFEALYHGVPMINFPSFADQPYNAKRADHHGFSETLPLLTFTSQELHDVILKVLKTDAYRENIRRASLVFRSRLQTPRERAAFWVEHVLQFGGQHLRSHALDMPAYQYLMLDILGAVLLVLASGIVLLYGTCSVVCKLWRSRNGSHQAWWVTNGKVKKQ